MNKKIDKAQISTNKASVFNNSSSSNGTNSTGNVDIDTIVMNGETVNYLQNVGKTMLNDLKEFNNTSNQFLLSLNEKLASEFKSVLQYSSEYKGKIDSMCTDNNERGRKLDILKQLREKLCNSNTGLQLKN